ncbi:hypothetical protein PJH10_29810, partial [Mycobacterium kansasii]
MVIKGWGDSGVATLSRPDRQRSAAAAQGRSTYSECLARLSGFAIRHKALVIGSWIAAAVV